MALVDERRVVLDRSACIRHLHNSAEEVGRRGELLIATYHQLDALSGCTGAKYTEGVGPYAFVHKYTAYAVLHLLARTQVTHHGDGLGSRSSLVQERAVSQGQTGQVADHGLENKQGLQASLTHLGLIGRIGGVPNGVLQHVALDDSRHDRTVPTASNQAAIHIVLISQLLHVDQVLLLG